MLKNKIKREKVLCTFRNTVLVSRLLNILRMSLAILWTIMFCFVGYLDVDPFYKVISVLVATLVMIESFVVCIRNLEINKLMKRFYEEHDENKKDKIFNEIYVISLFSPFLFLDLKGEKNVRR